MLSSWIPASKVLGAARGRLHCESNSSPASRCPRGHSCAVSLLDASDMALVPGTCEEQDLLLSTFAPRQLHCSVLACSNVHL